MNQIASILYAVGSLGIILFQLCLIAGAPWGRLTQGGKTDGSLPTSGRIVAAINILLFAAMSLAILSAAGYWPNWPIWAGWTTLAIQAVSAVLNWITPSVQERKLWGPTTLVMLLFVLLVMLSI
ncbi:hypothetical protein C1J03_25065 (plasmid) [Sulfitobacter sp. SK012]|uniref:hypothetical protein n=1 Tax=Sulfitobacter sp. SK012 TaxID=1389005 RepID=UPI000E0ABDE2|nr:hypothetical protein [Sulfitobacter sp. SK012]AXI49374.1 hypothetical protein C1J03_25065 [Sulfitobacter sp. SK012]